MWIKIRLMYSSKRPLVFPGGFFVRIAQEKTPAAFPIGAEAMTKCTKKPEAWQLSVLRSIVQNYRFVLIQIFAICRVFKRFQAFVRSADPSPYDFALKLHIYTVILPVFVLFGRSAPFLN
jgi:hypothetical protein